MYSDLPDRNDIICAIVDKACKHPAVSTWYGKGVSLQSVPDLTQYRHSYSPSLDGFLNQLEDEVLNKILLEFNSIIYQCESHDDFIMACGARGYLRVPPILLFNNTVLRLRYNRYLHLYNNHNYQVSKDAHGYGNCGCSPATLEEDRRMVHGSPKFTDLVHLAHASIAACGYREYRRLLQTRSSLIPALIKAETDVYSHIEWGEPDIKDASPIYVTTPGQVGAIAIILKNDKCISVRTRGAGSFYIELPNCGGNIPYLFARLLLAIVGIRTQGNSEFFLDNKVRLHSISIPTHDSIRVCTDIDLRNKI